jgi:hypothetical protein
MKAYLTAFGDQLTGIIDITEKRTEIYLPFIPRIPIIARTESYDTSIVEPQIKAVKFEVVGFVYYEGSDLAHRIPHYRLADL